MALYVGHHGWPTKKILGFRWSKMAKITLETINFWRNIYISIFKFSPFWHIMKAYWWSLFNFSKFTKPFTRKEKKHSYSIQWEWQSILFLFRILICSAIFAFWNQDDARNIKRGNWIRQKARNDKIQYLFQK